MMPPLSLQELQRVLAANLSPDDFTALPVTVQVGLNGIKDAMLRDGTEVLVIPAQIVLRRDVFSAPKGLVDMKGLKANPMEGAADAMEGRLLIAKKALSPEVLAQLDQPEAPMGDTALPPLPNLFANRTFPPS